MNKYLKFIIGGIIIIIIIILLSWIFYVDSYKGLDYYLANIKDGKIIKDYDSFYTVENMVNIFNQQYSLSDNNTLFEFFNKKLKLRYSKEELLNKYKEYANIFNYNNSSELEQGEYIGSTEDLLDEAYIFSNNIYLCKLKNIENNKRANLLIEVDMATKTFNILDLQLVSVGDANE